MFTKEFEKKLEETLKRLNKTYETINAGGCGFFADTLANILANKGHRVKILLILYSKDDVKVAKQYRYDVHNLSCIEWAHIALCVDGKTVDATGIYKNLRQRYPQDSDRGVIELPRETLEEWLKEEHECDWSPLYDRSMTRQIANELESSLN